MLGSVRGAIVISAEHAEHIRTFISHNNCAECRADGERRHVQRVVFRYVYVHEYLAYAQPRIAEIRAGNVSVNARIWHRDFMRALHRRISSRVRVDGRKQSDSYLERLRMALSARNANAGYLRTFASRGASCLDR